MKVTINITKIYLIIICAIIALSIGIIVYAYDGNNPEIMGHSADEIEGGAIRGPLNISIKNTDSGEILKLISEFQEEAYLKWFLDPATPTTISAYIGFPEPHPEINTYNFQIQNQQNTQIVSSSEQWNIIGNTKIGKNLNIQNIAGIKQKGQEVLKEGDSIHLVASGENYIIIKN